MKRKISGIVATCASALVACFLICVFVPFFPTGEGASGAMGGQSGEAAAYGARSAASAANPDGGGRSPVSGGGDARPVYEEGAVLVTLAEGISGDDAIEVLSRDTGIAGLELVKEGVGFVKVGLPAGVGVEEALELMRGSSVVEASQPNFYYYIQDDAEGSIESGEPPATAHSAGSHDLVGVQIQDDETPATNDPNLGKQWDLGAIRAPEAWAQLMEEGKVSNESKADGAVCIAVVDEGFNANHEDLKDVVVETFNATKDEGDPDITKVTESTGQNGHGTHVAGIAAAQVNNGKGVAGVSHNAKLMLVKVCNDSGGMTTDTLVTAYDHIMKAADKYNVRVVNVSLGGPITPDNQGESDKLFFKSIDAAFEKGIVTVCSAGNNTSSSPVPYYNYPSDYPTAVSVINVNEEGKRSATSNYNDPKTGEAVKNISAPGTSIYSTFYGASKTDEENNVYYGYDSGTSMAAPHVAGVFALMFAATPGLTAAEAVSKLYSSAKDLQYTNGDEVAGEGWDPYTGYGEVDALAAVEATYFIRGGVSVDSGKSIQLACSRDDKSNVWSSSDESIATVSADGVVAGLKDGQVEISVTNGKQSAVQLITVKALEENPAEETAIAPEKKLANTMKVKGLTKEIKQSKLKKKAKNYKTLVSVKKAQGQVTFEKISGSEKIVVKKDGTVKVKKKLKPGRHKVRIRVSALGNDTYAPASEKVTAIIRVK